MKRGPRFKRFHGLLLGMGAMLAVAPSGLSASGLSPEQRTYEISQHLKLITNDEWKEIAGGQASRTYTLLKGDTLYTISKKLLGDAKYWPKLWAINHETISNPHEVSPGLKLAFVSSGDFEGVTPAPSQKPSHPLKRSEEWRSLPHQRWEAYQIQLPSNVDPLGFDENSIVRFGRESSFDLPAIIKSEKIDPIGQIIGARIDATYLTLGNIVFIRPQKDMQVGDVYAVTNDPEKLGSTIFGRSGYSYLLLGTVKLIGERDHLYVGTIESGANVIQRGNFLMPVPPPVQMQPPIPAPRPLKGDLLLDHRLTSSIVAQHKEVFIDRGTEDGVQPGMVFRAYEHRDPGNGKNITNSNIMIDADMIVVQADTRFSAAIVTKSVVPIQEGTSLMLLTDLSDINSTTGFHDLSEQEKEAQKALDELDQTSGKDGMTPAEARELKQLEKWKGNPSKAQASPLPSSTPAADELLPPPPSPAPAPDASPVPPLEDIPSAEPPPMASTPSADEPPPPPPPPPSTGDSVPQSP